MHALELVKCKGIHVLQLQSYSFYSGGCNPKKPYPSLTFSRVGVGFFWVLLGFFGFFWVFKKLIIFADFCIHNVRICTCYNIHIQMMK